MCHASVPILKRKYQTDERIWWIWIDRWLIQLLLSYASTKMEKKSLWPIKCLYHTFHYKIAYISLCFRPGTGSKHPNIAVYSNPMVTAAESWTELNLVVLADPPKMRVKFVSKPLGSEEMTLHKCHHRRNAHTVESILIHVTKNIYDISWTKAKFNLQEETDGVIRATFWVNLRNKFVFNVLQQLLLHCPN